jgi:hypothetical protein
MHKKQHADEVLDYSSRNPTERNPADQRETGAALESRQEMQARVSFPALEEMARNRR